MPGTLIRSEEISTQLTGAKAWKVRYHSSDVNGRAHEVTGLVIAPDGSGAERPVMTWGHGTTGLGDAACPSAQPDPARNTINIMHAARSLNVGAGTSVGCMGWSEGGGTAAAVAELDPDDYGDLILFGVVPMSPAVASVGLKVGGSLFAALDDPSIPRTVKSFRRSWDTRPLTPTGSPSQTFSRPWASRSPRPDGTTSPCIISAMSSPGCID